MRRFWGVLVGLLVGSASGAQEVSPLIAMDRRGEILGWEAVGRIDTPQGICTGVLIAPDIALTAAHCVFEPSGRQIAADKIRFRAGYHKGRSMADRTAAAVFVHDSYAQDPSGQISGGAMRYDVALLRLSASISSAEASPFRIFDGDMENLPVSVVSYGRGREEVLSRQAECAVLRRYSAGQIAFDCAVTYGSSGAPVFMKQDNRIRIVSLISAGSAPGTTEGESYGMALPDLVDELMREMRNDNALPKVTTGARRVTVGQRMNSGGARFVRP